MNKVKVKLIQILLGLALQFLIAQSAFASIKIEPKNTTNVGKKGELNVYLWQDYIAPDMIHRFEAETGIKVNYQTFDNVGLMEQSAARNFKGYDLVMPEIAFVASHYSTGKFLKFDESKVPNIENSDVQFLIKAQKAKYPDGYSANYLWGTIGIGYNHDMLKSRLGDVSSLSSWASVFEVGNIQKISDCGVWLVDSPRDIYPLILNYLGENPNDLSEPNLIKANLVLSKIKPYIRNFDSSGYISALADGRACAVVGWSGDVFQAAMLSEDAGNLNKIVYNIPKEGTVAWMDVFSIPGNAVNIDNAYAFINFMLRPENAGANAEYVNYSSANSKDKTIASANHFLNKSIYPDADVMNRIFFNEALDKEIDTRLKQYWRKALIQ